MEQTSEQINGFSRPNTNQDGLLERRLANLSEDEKAKWNIDQLTAGEKKMDLSDIGTPSRGDVAAAKCVEGRSEGKAIGRDPESDARDARLMAHVRHERLTPLREMSTPGLSSTNPMQSRGMAGLCESTADSPLVPGSQTNRYQDWECGFGFKHADLTPAAVPATTDELIDAVMSELNAIDTIKAGLTKYIKVINSGEHTTFDQDFLDKQGRGTDLTLMQLDKVTEHLRKVLQDACEIDCIAEFPSQIREGLREVYSHAKPFISRARQIMIHSHVFYKTNYALAADSKQKEG